MTVELLNARLTSAGIKLPAYLILRNISESPETVGDLAGMLQSSIQNASSRVEGLESLGMVERVRGSDTDKRKVQVCITQKGREALGGIEGE